MSYTGVLKVNDFIYSPVGSSLYGTCSTGASTQTKEVVLSAFDDFLTGITIYVKFTNANTAASPKLQVGSTTAKFIKPDNAKW